MLLFECEHSNCRAPESNSRDVTRTQFAECEQSDSSLQVVHRFTLDGYLLNVNQSLISNDKVNTEIIWKVEFSNIIYLANSQTALILLLCCR